MIQLTNTTTYRDEKPLLRIRASTHLRLLQTRLQMDSRQLPRVVGQGAPALLRHPVRLRPRAPALPIPREKTEHKGYKTTCHHSHEASSRERTQLTLVHAPGVSALVCPLTKIMVCPSSML